MTGDHVHCHCHVCHYESDARKEGTMPPKRLPKRPHIKPNAYLTKPQFSVTFHQTCYNVDRILQERPIAVVLMRNELWLSCGSKRLAQGYKNCTFILVFSSSLLITRISFPNTLITGFMRRDSRMRFALTDYFERQTVQSFRVSWTVPIPSQRTIRKTRTCR